MKKISSTVLFLLSTIYVSAQWIPLNSGTTVNLYDVDFLDADNGLAVGDSGTVLLTNNGGAQWTPLNFGTSNVGAVKMVSLDTFVVSYLDFNNIPHQSFTHLAGIFWIPLQEDSFCYRVIDTDVGSDYKWISIGSSVMSTVDHGQFWDTLMNFTCGTNNIDRIQAVDDSYNAGGLISGFATYSASMIRSEDGGNNFYAYDPFSFPNADALTAFDFPTADTGYVFMNQYNGFVPGTRNSVVKVFNFSLASPFPGDTNFVFNSAVLDTTIPAYINDGKFMQQHGFAAGEDGNIYESNNGGMLWNLSYNNNNIAVNRFSFPDSQTGYAVGDNGTILKYSPASAIEEKAFSQMILYPNPASTFIQLRGMTSEKYFLSDLEGRNVQNGNLENGRIELNNISSGTYMLIVNKDNKIFRNKVMVISE